MSSTRRTARLNGTNTKRQPRQARVNNGPVANPARIERSVTRRFRQLKSKWKRETAHLSRLESVILHPAYLRIIAMGQAAIPHILRELEIKPDYWFTALNATSGANPIPTGVRLTIDETAAAWLRWGRKHGHSR